MLDIDINDDKLKAVVDLMGKYQAAASRMPGAWASIGKQQATSKDVLVDIRNLMLVHIALLDRESKAFEGVRRQVDSTHRSMQGLSRSTREFVGHMRSATSILLRWSGVGGLIAGLTGVLSAEGISRLAGTGAGMFRSSMSLAGTSPGQVGAAGSYGGILNPRQVLGQISQMLTTAEGKRGLLGVGIGQNMWGMGAGNLLPPFLQNLQRLSKSPMMGPNGEIMGDVLNAQGLGQFTELAQILRNMKPEQLAQLTNEYTKNQRELNKVTQETLFQYVKLQGTIEVAEAKIKSAFIVALEPMAPQFARIADAVSTAILHFGESEEVKKWMTELATQLENVDMDAFAKRLEELGTSFVTVGRAVAGLITGLADVISWIDNKLGKDDKSTKYGLIAGAGVGAAAGSVLGPPGAIVGGLVGAGVGGVMGAQAQQQREYGRVVASAAIPPPPGGGGGTGAAGSPTGPGGRWFTGSARGPIAEGQMFNYGGLRAPKDMGGFRTYPNPFAGVADMGDLLKKYPGMGANTLNSIINKWAPSSDNNNTELLIKRAESWTGFHRDQQLNLSDPQTLRKVMIAMNRNEMGGKQTIPNDVLDRYIGIQGANSGTSGNIAGTKFSVDSAMAARVNKLIADAPPEIQQQLRDSITSGHRSHKEQTDIYARSLREGFTAAKPGNSWHEQGAGFAMDLNRVVRFPKAAAYLRQNAPNYGLGFPLPAHLNDPWHMQMSEMPISVRRPSNVRVTVQNETGANPISSTSQVAQ